MKQPTHFIEQWKSKWGTTFFTPARDLFILPSALLGTRYVGGKTIAIFKITPKTKQP